MDHTVESLYASGLDPADRSLGARYAPVVRFDAGEPFLPLAAACTVLRESGPSPSFERDITLDGAAAAIEYAIWWDWDIGHLYELEHVWVWIDAAGRVVRAEASAHGGYAPMTVDGAVPLRGDRLVVCAEPGKHAFAADPSAFARLQTRDGTRLSQTEFLAGIGGVLVKDMFRDQLAPTMYEHRLARSWLCRHAFTPTWRFDNDHVLQPHQLVSWDALREWIPGRMSWWLRRLHDEVAPRDYRFWRIGHRGAAAHAPDNSLQGIAKAAELWADMVEIDVRMRRDGVVVLSHDPLRDDHDHPTLDEALALCRSQAMGAYIELKDGRCAEAVAQAVRDRRMRRSVVVGSFVPDWIANFGAAAPDIDTSILFHSVHPDPVALATAVGARYAHPCWERFGDPCEHLTRSWIDRVRDAGLGVVCWHEERAEVIDRLRGLAVDGICSDAPELLT